MTTAVRDVDCPGCQSPLRFGDAPVRESFRCPECGERLNAKETAAGVDVWVASAEEPSNTDRAAVASVGVALPELRVSASVTAGVVVGVLAVVAVSAILMSDNDGDKAGRQVVATGDSGTAGPTGATLDPSILEPADPGSELVSAESDVSSTIRPVNEDEDNRDDGDLLDALLAGTAVPDADAPSQLVSAVPEELKAEPSGAGETQVDVKAANPNSGAVQQTAGERKVAENFLQGQDQPGDEGRPDRPDGIKQPPAIVVVEQPAEPAVKPVPLGERLAVRLQEFHQAEPIELKTLITDLEFMAAIEVEVDSLAEDVLEKKLRLSMTDTSPREVLAEAAKRFNLRLEVDDEQVRFVDASAANQE